MLYSRKRGRNGLRSFCIAGLGLLLLSGASQDALAGPLRFLFGGGGGGGQAYVNGYPNGQYRRGLEDAVSRQTVPFTTRHAPGTVVVSFTDRRLYYVTQPGMALSYLIGVPAGDARWSGVLHVSHKKVNPPWTPTPDMRRENPELPPHVPGGDPKNPLGVRALYLGNTLYRIHGTDAPWTVGAEVTHGCIRLYNNDVIDLYQRVPVGAKVVITWDSFQSVASGPLHQSPVPHAPGTRMSEGPGAWPGVR
ncbi:MAG: L,D-transpeptidase [Hyphomicrobiales bacterium]